MDAATITTPQLSLTDPLDGLLTDPAANRAFGMVLFLGPVMGGLIVACEEMHRLGMSLEDARFVFEFQFGVRDDDARV